MIRKEDILHFMIVLLCAMFITFLAVIVIETIFALLIWQPFAGRVLIYGLIAIFVFHRGYSNIDIIEMDDDDNE